MKILLVERDQGVAALISKYLIRGNFLVELATDGSEALALLGRFSFDVVLIDTFSSDTSGLEICRSYRESGGTALVVMLSGEVALEEKERWYRCGIDDYLTKPFHPKELLLRMQALLRRIGQSNQHRLRYKNLILNSNRTASWFELKIPLTAREFYLLEFLVRNPETVFSSDFLACRVWPSKSIASSKAVRTCLCRLRDKLRLYADLDAIKTVPGYGYKLMLP